MQKFENQVELTCPLYQKQLENDETFNQVGEYQLISCPECLAHLVTVKKDGELKLEYFEF